MLWYNSIKKPEYFSVTWKKIISRKSFLDKNKNVQKKKLTPNVFWTFIKPFSMALYVGIRNALNSPLQKMHIIFIWSGSLHDIQKTPIVQFWFFYSTIIRKFFYYKHVEIKLINLYKKFVYNCTIFLCNLVSNFCKSALLDKL